MSPKETPRQYLQRTWGKDASEKMPCLVVVAALLDRKKHTLDETQPFLGLSAHAPGEVIGGSSMQRGSLQSSSFRTMPHLNVDIRIHKHRSFASDAAPNGNFKLIESIEEKKRVSDMAM